MTDSVMDLKETLRNAGVVDTHYHVGPELIARRYDVKTIADVAAPFGATLVLKNHTYPTTPLASLARKHFGARFLGGVVLNRYVGGLNPQAIEGARSGNRAEVADASARPWCPWWCGCRPSMPARTSGFTVLVSIRAGPAAATMVSTMPTRAAMKNSRHPPKSRSSSLTRAAGRDRN